MNKNQPLLAFIVLKISESYFCAKNDPNEYYIIKDLSYLMAKTDTEEKIFQLEVD